MSKVSKFIAHLIKRFISHIIPHIVDFGLNSKQQLFMKANWLLFILLNPNLIIFFCISFLNHLKFLYSFPRCLFILFILDLVLLLLMKNIYLFKKMFVFLNLFWILLFCFQLYVEVLIHIALFILIHWYPFLRLDLWYADTFVTVFSVEAVKMNTYYKH